MTLTDYTLKNKGPPEWIEEDQIVSVQGHIGEDIIIELKLAVSENYNDLRFELIRDGLPISSDRYQLSMRDNIVQLALKQSRKNDTGYYSLVATRLGQENDKGALKKIHLSISEPSYEEGDPPVFLRRLSDLAVKVGTRTRFLVEIRSSTTLKIIWYKDDLPIHDGLRFSLVHEGNFHCVDVAPVTVEDQGCWTCMAENHSGRSSCTSTLTVIVPKAYKKPEFVEELRALLTETGTVSLECKVIGVPTPVLRWFKDNKEIKAGDVFALTANPDDPTSLGIYTCEAINCMGTAYSSSKVHVAGRGSREGSLKPADALASSGPLPIFKQILQDECCRIGDTIVLSCRVQVPPWPKAIAWYNKEGRIESSEKYHVIEDGIGGYSIEVRQVEAMDEGEWKCVATSENNMKQFTSCYVAMSIPRNYRKPRFMENLKAVLTEEGLVSFECKVVGFPTPLLRWFKDGQELKPGDVYQLTGTNSLGSYCCIARNCMGEAKSTAELTIEDIQNQLNEEERFQLLSTNQPPKFIKGLRSCEARINEDFRFTVQVSIAPEPTLSWYRDDALMDTSDKYHLLKENLGTCHFEVRKLEFVDQAEWKCVAANDFGHSVTSCFLKLIIPKHYKKPKFLDSLRAILSEEGAVNLECKVIGVPQPILKWYKDNVELKPGDIHRIISGQDGTCCLGIYTCEATNCMGTVSSSASLLGFEDKKNAKEIQSSNDHELARNLSLSTIHEERTSQLYDTPQTDHSVTLDERGEVSFSFDGKEVSVSLYETPDLTEEEALQIVEMYADQLSEHVTEHNVIELPPMRFVKETSTTGNLLMEAVVIDVSPDYFVSAEDGDDLRTEADFEDVSIMDDVTHVFSSPERDSRGSLKRSARHNADEDEKVPNRPPRKKSMSLSSSKSEKSQRIESESFHSAQKDEPPLSPLSSFKQDDSDTFADALSSAHLSIAENLVQKYATSEHETADSRKRSLSAEKSTGSSLDDGIGGDSSLDSIIDVPKKKQRKKKQQKDKNSSEEYSGPSNCERRRSELEDKTDTKIKHQLIESVEKIEMDYRNGTEAVKELFSEEKLLNRLKSTKEVNSHVSEEIQESTKDFLSESRTALRKALESFYEKADTVPQFSSIYERVDDIHQLLEISGETDNLETLTSLEIPLSALLREINEITSMEHAEIIRNILEPSIVQLSHVIENLGLLSLQSTLVILEKLSMPIYNISSETKELSSTKSLLNEFQNISEKIVDLLIDIQSMFNKILNYVERLKLMINGSTTESGLQQVATASSLVACLAELRECASHTAHTAMTLKENKTLNSLIAFRGPLLDLQSILTLQKCTFLELSIIKEINLAILKLKSVVIIILKNSEDHEIISRIEAILKILEDTDKQISKLVEQLSETEAIQKYRLRNLNIDQSLSNVHFALSSVLEKQEKYIASSEHLITSIEALRQSIGSSAVTIASLKNPIDDEITQEISKLNKLLLNLQRDLLTEKHEPREEQILNDLMNPISILKEIVYNVIESSSRSSIELMVPMLELLEDIEKDTALITKEISKKKYQEENITQSQRENIEEKSISKSNLASQICRSLDPIKNWLSATSEDSIKQYKDEMESALSSTIEELKRDVNQIAIQTSYSESPSDESLINALIGLQEPLVRLKNAIFNHEPKDLSILENLDYPMKCLLQIIMDVLHKHAEEKSLRPIIDIMEQIKNQISVSTKESLYQQKLKQNAKTINVETKEEEGEGEENAITASRTIPGTLTEVASTLLEAESFALLTEQAITENNSKSITHDIVLQTTKNKEQKREENTSKLIMILSETLEKLQLEITSILEDFEESTAQITTIPQSKLANSIEELRRTISTIRVMTIYGEETSLEEKLNQTILVLTNLMQPLTNIRNLLSKSHEHDVSELIILNRFTPLLNIIENNMIRQIIDFVGTDKDVEKEFESLLCVLENIKTEIPIVIQEISLRRKILEYLWDISKPLESILERMSDLEKTTEETLETDVANILGKPIAILLEDIKITIQEVDMLDRREPLILELRNLLEPLLEFHSCLSMVQSSRRSLVPEASLLDERRSVILRAVDGLQKQICHIVEVIANMEEAFLFNESLTLLNSAILQVQKQIGRTDYSRRSSSTNISLQHRLTGTLNRLANSIIALEEHADKDTYGIVSKCLEALQKQISFAQTQFSQIGSELIDEEAIIEGFLYPTNQLLSALNILKENTQKTPSAISHNLIDQLQELADSISELSSSLSTHKTRLVQEGTSETAPIVETFSAVIDVLDHVKDSINVIKQTVDVEQKASMIITKVENVIDEIIEVSQEQIESIMVVTEIPSSKAIVQEIVRSEIEDTPIIIQTPVLKNLEAIIPVEHTKDDLADMKKCKENERHKHLMTEISKFNSAINNLIQPLKELINFLKSAKQESLISKSEENKRKIQELTALIQILNDLQATNTSIKTVIASSPILLLSSQFSHMENILADFEEAVNTIISLTHEGVKPELKENIMTSLSFISKPLSALENVLASICQTIYENRYIDKDEESLSAIAETLMSCINVTTKSLNEMQISKHVSITDEREISKIKEETKDIEKTTARPLEELIEAIMESQEQVKCDKTLLLKSNSPSTDMIETKSIDNLKSKVELNETFIKKIDDSMKQDAIETLQQTLTSSESNQIKELHIENIGVIKSIEEPLEEVKENLATIDQQKIKLTEITKISENNIIQEGQIKVETLRTIISSLQALCKSFDEIGETEIFKSFDKKKVAFSALMESLLNLQVALSSEVTEDIKQNTVTLLKLSIVSVLEELQKSIVTVQEQVQLNTVTEASSSMSKMFLIQAVIEPLENLRLSIACIQSDPISQFNQFIQQGTELLNVEQITILQNLTKSVVQFGERFISIINQVKTVSPLQIIKQKGQQPKILHKIVEPIHILRERLSQIENFNSYEAELLQMPEQRRKIIQLGAVIDSLEKLEQSLITSKQQITIVQEEDMKEFSKNQNLLTSANLKPVLEELRNSIIIFQEQIIFNKDIPILKILNEALENLKVPLTTIEEVVDHIDNVTEIEEVSTLLSFAKSVEETTNQLVVIAEEDTKQAISETSLLKTIIIPIEELQSTMLKLEDRVSQTLETKDNKSSKKVVTLECMIQPLQELQQSFLTASYQETVLVLQRLPIKSTLDNLNKSVAVIQDQVMIIQDNLLVNMNTDDLITLKDFARSLGNLRTSMVVLQQLNAIENAGQQIVEIENASALQAFAKSIEEFKKCCSVIVERPRIIEAFTTNIELKQSNKIDTHLIENIIAPLRILQEQILTIEETKMQESEILDVTEIRKPVTVLSSLVGPLQQLEKSFVATVQKEHVIEHDGHNLTTKSSSISPEKLALQPILEEVQKSIATVQEHVILEAGSQITASEIKAEALLKSIAQPLIDLKASIASIQQVTAIAPECLNELVQEQNISALETFAEILHNLTERIATCNHQQIIMEPVADTISEDVSSLNTWADVIDESSSKIKCPMVINQGAIESPVEIAMSMSEDEISTLKTLAKPLTELREYLALIVEEQKTVPSCDTVCSLPEKENISLMKTIIQPLLELKQAAAIIIQEQMTIERANEHSFVIDDKNEFILRPLIEPLEELRHSIAIIQDQMLVETSTDRSKNDVILGALAEPLFDLQRAISVLETRVMSPDVESMPEDTGNNWITECLATPLHEIERSIADIRQCNIMEPETITVEEQTRTLIPNWSIIEKLAKQMESIKSAILRMEDDSIEIEILKTMEEPLTNIQENLTLLRSRYNLGVKEKGSIDAFVESLSNFEKCISFVKEEIIDKVVSQSDMIKIDATISALNIPLTELKCSIVTIKKSPSENLNNLERPLILVQNALETIVSIQRDKKLSELSAKIINSISDISKSVESIKSKLKQQQVSTVEIYIEYEALEILTKSLQNIKQCIIQIQDKPNTANSMSSALQRLEKSIAVMREQSADKPLAEPQRTNFGVFSKSLIPCLYELQESIEATKTLWHEETVLDGLVILEKSIYKLQAAMNIICNQSLEETILIIDKHKTVLPKESVKKEIITSEIEITIEKDDKINETVKEETKETKLVKDIDPAIINDKDKEDKKDEENKKKLKKKKEKIEEKDYEESKLIHGEIDQVRTKNEKQKKEDVIQEMQKVNEKQERKEIEQVKEETEQSEKNMKNEKIKQDKKECKKAKETYSFEKHKEAEKIKEIENLEKMDTTEDVRNGIKESEKRIDVEEMRKEKSEQTNEEDVEGKEENNQTKAQEIVQEKKKIDECKKTETNQGTEEKAKNKIKSLIDTEKKEEQLKEKEEKVDIIEKRNEQKDIDKLKPTEQHERKDVTKEETQEKDKEIDTAQQKKRESVKTEIEMVQKEKDKPDKEAEAKEIKKNMNEIFKEDEKLVKEQENFENNKCTARSQTEGVQKKQENFNLLKKEEQKEERKEEKKQESTKNIKREESEKAKDQKTEELEKEIEKFDQKKEYVQEKIEEQEQKERVEEIKKQEELNKESIEKIKEEKEAKAKSEKTEKLEKKKDDSSKKREIKQEKQKKQDEVKTMKKEDEERKAIIKVEKTVENEQAKIRKNVQEDKKKATEKDKMEDQKVEKTREEPIEKDEIVKTEEIIQQTQYRCINDIKEKDDTSESRRNYKEINKDQEQKQIKQKQKEKVNEETRELALTKDKNLCMRIDVKKQKDERMLQKQQEESKSEFEKLEKVKEEDEWKQRKLQSDEKRLYMREERITRGGECKVQKEKYDYQERDNDKRLHRMETERFEKKRTVREAKDMANYVSAADEERSQKRSEEKRIRRDETARLLWEEERRLRKRQEEERFRNRQRKKEQIRENEWSRKRENESDRFLRNMLEVTCKPNKSTSMFFDVDYPRDYTFRFDSGIPMLSSTSRSYSWRDSLASLNGKRLDDYWDYKLHSPSIDKYYFDTGSSYRRRRKRENRMIRARSISLLKYKDYSTGDSDATIVPSTRIRPLRRTKAVATSRIGFDTCESSYTDLRQSESLLWNKPKKPSFCTRLTNRVVGVGMRIRLTCTVLGNPEPHVYWMKDNQKLNASDNRCRMRYESGMAYLEFHDVLPEDAGVYTCVAENTHGTSTTESILRVYSDYKPTHSPPTFIKSIKEIYRYFDHKLILECRVRAHPVPMISWLKDGIILQGERYKQSYLDDDVYRLEIANPDITDNGQYTCRAVNELHTEETSHIVQVEDWRSVNRTDLRLNNQVRTEFARRPHFSNLLKDYNVPAGKTIALQGEVEGAPPPEVKWLRGDRKEPITIPKARTLEKCGLYTLIVPEVTESEKGTYVCRATNAYGQVDTSAMVDVISSSTVDGGKPAVFVSRPSKKSIDVIVGEDISISFRVSGIPKPRIIWMKGLTDITDGPRSYKESIDDYVRLTLKRVMPSDEGTYCILIKNRYGCDRSFFSIKVKQRARSLTPLSDWNSVTERDAEEYDNDMSYVRNVPGPISSEPVVIDGGKSWLSLSWGKAERRGPAPVIAYKVEAWLLGGDGGARWVELGVTPINAFDAFNLRPGGEYKFRVTPRNRYGWGEPVTMTNSVLVIESTDLPEFTKILPGQLKTLEGAPVKLECEIRGDSKMEVRWYRETTEINPFNDPRFATYYNGSKCSLTIANIKEDDSGRYICEANNRIGKVSSFARILVVTDPRIIEADAKLKTSLSIEPEDRPPHFTMRIRDRRVQTTYPVRLTCQVIGHPVPEITWYKNGIEISQDDRHIFWDDDSNFHTLEIVHSTLEDSGCYMATAKNINGSVSCRCILVVDKGIRAYIAPEFLRDLNRAYTIHSGGELQMSAQLEAYPSVGVVWHRDGIRLRPSRRATMTLSHDGTVQFFLANVTMRDAGVYSCTATNVVGQTETSTRVAVTAAIQDQSSIDESFNVTSTCPDVPYSKEPLFVTKPLSTEAIEGDTVIIFCEVVGDPKPEIIWLRDFLKPDYYRDAPHFRLVGAGPQYRLEIPYAKLDFTGTYSVIARNCHGEAKAVISLQIYAKGQGKEAQTQKSPYGKVLTLPIIKRELRDLRCCDSDAVSLECKVYATPEPPLIRWERGGKIMAMVGDFAAEFDGETARLNIQHVYPEDEGEYTCVAYNDLGKAYTSACLIVDVPEGKENILSQRLTRPMGLLSAGSTPRSTPRSTPIRSLSPAVPHGREFRSPQVLPRGNKSKRPKVCPPKFYAVPHNRLVQEGETVRFQCAVVGHPVPWIKWDKNGTIVTPSTRISIKERDDVKILEIIDVMKEDAALYRVTAENDFGRIEASARLEVINRYESTSRTIRTRSASPRTYPSFDRSLLPTTSRINSRLQLECRVRGTPSVTSTWYRNGRPLERSSRIKRHFDGTTARIEISKVKASDAGEYTCIATNILGSMRNSCQVIILDPHDSSTADKNPPRFLQSLPKESIVMENYCHEFQTGVTGTPPFTITWSKDSRELPDNDYYKYVVYGDGGIALRISEVRPQDAGEYSCIIRNDFGIASCSGLFAVQDYKNVFKLPLQFTKTPLSVIAAKGTTACFCARAQCGKTIEIIWTINGKDARENAKCKIEKDGNVSILKIRDITSRETGEIRCVASVNGKSLSISCIAKLQLQNSLYDSNDFVMEPKDIQVYAEGELLLTNTNLASMPKKMAKLSSLKHQQSHEKLTRTRSSSFPRCIASNTKHISPLPLRKRISDDVLIDIQKSRFADDLLVQKIIKKNLDSNLFKHSKEQKLSLNEDIIDTSIKLLSPKKMKQFCHQNIDSVPSKEYVDSHLEELIKATIIEEPTDISVFRGSRTVLKVTYQGCPEPTVKWLRVNRELRPDEKIEIVSRDGVSYLTLDEVTYDHAGKYEVSVENPLGKDRRFFSLAVEGPPEPLADKPSVNFNAGQITIVWRSPSYDGGRIVIGYTVEAKRVGESTWMVIAESCHSLSHTVATTERNFVTPGESYRFRIRAENMHGLSDPGMESDPVRIPKQEETMLQEEEDEFESSFEARLVVPEEGKFFGERYDVLEELGKGRYGIVKKVIERSTGMNFAAKFIKTIKAKDREQVREEIKIMNALRHPKLLLLAAAYESPRETVLITEYISGGELFERVVADDFTLTERDSILFMRQICQGVEYMHQNKIVHLDLKPENIMCRTRTSYQIKLIDFGLAQVLKSDTPIRVLFGTPEFIPPEIISYEPIGTESDMWSVGVICYVLLTGLSPFMGDNDAETFANITRADYDLEDEAFDAISNDAKNFISSLLIKRKELRMSATQCLEHPWMVQHATAMSRIVLPTEKLKKFIIRRKWQKTGNAIRALGRMAILSAHSRRSPTVTAESSPTFEQRFDSIEMQHSDGIKSIRAAVDKDRKHDETNTGENSVEVNLQTNLHSTCVTEANVTIQETSTKKESNLNDLTKQINIEKEMLRLELISKAEDTPNVTTHLEILVSKENQENNREMIDKSPGIEQHMIPKSQTLRKVFRGDSRDSGIGDCNSSLVTSSLQIDELGKVSTIEEEIDHETHNRENKRTLKKEENRRSSTGGILVSLVQDKKIFPIDTKITLDDDKVATKSDMTKASCETNPVRKDIDENTDTRILSRHNHDKFLLTGNVSRTARIFERESERSNSNNSQVSTVQRAYPATMITEKPHNERIQKAFAFWNK